MSQKQSLYAYALRFLIDANLPRSAVGLLVGLGHFVDFARDIGLASAPDEAIAKRAQTLGTVSDAYRLLEAGTAQGKLVIDAGEGSRPHRTCSVILSRCWRIDIT
jgi:hypothetical protein